MKQITINITIDGNEIKDVQIDVPKKETESKPVYSMYARFFDELSPMYWENNLEANIQFLSYMEQYFNELLKNRGYVYLNEVFRYLGFTETSAGNLVGWVYDPDNAFTDNCIKFTVNVNHGSTNSILIDFNVDGDISKRTKKGEL